MKRYFLSKIKSQQYLLALGDSIVIFLSFFVTYIINFSFFVRRSYRIRFIFDRMLPWVVILVLLYIFVFYLNDLYTRDKIKNLSRCLLTISIYVLVISLICSGILFFFIKYIIGRKVIIINIPIVICLLMLWRFIFVTLILQKEKPRRLALVGEMQTFLSFIKEFRQLEMAGFRITQIYITMGGHINKSLLPESVTICERISDILENLEFDILVFDYTIEELLDQEIRQILQLKFQGKSISDFPSFYEELTGKVPVNSVDSRWFIEKGEFQGKASKAYVRIKRLLDIGCSILLLTVTFPLFILISIAIKFDSKGKIFFSQERLGIMNRPFPCYKFRTMKMDAEKETGPIWSSKKDQRITRVGKTLRKTRLDELPQLWNILKGDMSFVGSRPIRKYFADQLAKIILFYDLRFSVKPGLTGWAQVNHSYSGSKEEQVEKFQYELFYIKNMSLFLDLFIIFKTLKTVFKREGE